MRRSKAGAATLVAAAAIWGGPAAAAAPSPLERAAERPFLTQQPQPPRPVAPGSVSMEDLARQGYEVKSMVQAATRGGSYVVLMQRAGDVRTCLLRIEFSSATVPVRQSACF